MTTSNSIKVKAEAWGRARSFGMQGLRFIMFADDEFIPALVRMPYTQLLSDGVSSGTERMWHFHGTLISRMMI
jgi:hypothetical protein